jgi:hypothetical protein
MNFSQNCNDNPAAHRKCYMRISKIATAASVNLSRRFVHPESVSTNARIPPGPGWRKTDWLGITGGHCDDNLLPIDYHLEAGGVADGVEAVQHKVTVEAAAFGPGAVIRER